MTERSGKTAYAIIGILVTLVLTVSGWAYVDRNRAWDRLHDLEKAQASVVARDDERWDATLRELQQIRIAIEKIETIQRGQLLRQQQGVR